MICKFDSMKDGALCGSKASMVFSVQWEYVNCRPCLKKKPKLDQACVKPKEAV